MSDYCTVAELKVFNKITASTDDTLLGIFITTASREIDLFCKRRFYGDEETRYFDPTKNCENNVLYVDADLQSVEEIINGDGAEITSDQYVLLPTNPNPAGDHQRWAIKLKRSAAVSWTWEDDPEEAIEVTGIWGYVSGTVPPAPIKHACLRLSMWHYHQKDAPFETIGLNTSGEQVVPTSLPGDVERLLDPYIRRGVIGMQKP